MLKKTFCIPYNGDLYNTKLIIDEIGSHIYEFYGSDYKFFSGRYSEHIDDKFEESVKLIKSSNIEFNYLLNSINIDNYIINKKKLIKHLEFLKKIGVDTITSSFPYFVPMIKQLGFKVSTSLMQFIDSEDAIIYLQNIGYDRIIINEDILKDIKKIKYLKSVSNVPIEIIVNNACLLNCPFRITHLNANAINHPAFLKEMRDNLTSYSKQCKSYWAEDIIHFLKSSWIRPEELIKYKSIGVDFFKFTGRTRPSLDNLKIFTTYAKGDYNGYVFDYLKPYSDPVKKYGVKNILNKDLDSFFDFFFTDKTGCDYNCQSCGHCRVWAKKILKNKN